MQYKYIPAQHGQSEIVACGTSMFHIETLKQICEGEGLWRCCRKTCGAKVNVDLCIAMHESRMLILSKDLTFVSHFSGSSYSSSLPKGLMFSSDWNMPKGLMFASDSSYI